MPSPKVPKQSMLDYPTILVARGDGLDGHVVRCLEQAGFHVLEAEGWELVFDAFKRHSRPIHLLLVDESLNARAQVLKYYRSELQIMFAKKPIDVNEVLATIRQLLGLPPSSTGPASTPHGKQPEHENTGDSLRRQEIEKARLNIIDTSLDLCLTFAMRAETARYLGYREHSERALASAERGYWDMLRLFTLSRELAPTVERQLRSKLIQVRERLDEQLTHAESTTERAVAAEAR